jgi:hypothetical protein
MNSLSLQLLSADQPGLVHAILCNTRLIVCSFGCGYQQISRLCLEVTASTGAGQHITEPLGGQERMELHDLHRLALPWQPTGEQAPIIKGQRSMPSLSRHAAGHLHQLHGARRPC